MIKIEKVLSVCKANSDRSPFMAAALGMFLSRCIDRAPVLCESAGILEVADASSVSPLMATAARRIGINLSAHRGRWIDRLEDLESYDLFVCVDDEVAAHVIQLGVSKNKICNARINNCWPSTFQRDLDDTAESILAAMFRVVTQHFSVE